MELDDLKKNWQKTQIKTNLNTNIMELIKHKSYGPLAALKNVFKKQIILMCIIPFVLLLTNLNDVHAVYTSILFWSYVAFCIGTVCFAYYNYRIVGKMEHMDEAVKHSLEQQILLLEKRANLEIMGLRVILIFFIVLTEVVPYFQHYRMLDLWHSLNPLIRFGSYSGLLLLQFLLNKRLKQKKVGRHLDYLKELVKEME